MKNNFNFIFGFPYDMLSTREEFEKENRTLQEKQIENEVLEDVTLEEREERLREEKCEDIQNQEQKWGEERASMDYYKHLAD